MKKDGGTITNWQVHNLSFTQAQIDKVYPNTGAMPKVMTGTVVNDPSGRWPAGYHMRSSLLTRINRKKGIVETLNTKYKVTGTEGADIFKDLGDDVMNIIY